MMGGVADHTTKLTEREASAYRELMGDCIAGIAQVDNLLLHPRLSPVRRTELHGLRAELVDQAVEANEALGTPIRAMLLAPPEGRA